METKLTKIKQIDIAYRKNHYDLNCDNLGKTYRDSG